MLDQKIAQEVIRLRVVYRAAILPRFSMRID